MWAFGVFSAKQDGCWPVSAGCSPADDAAHVSLRASLLSLPCHSCLFISSWPARNEVQSGQKINWLHDRLWRIRKGKTFDNKMRYRSTCRTRGWDSALATEPRHGEVAIALTSPRAGHECISRKPCTQWSALNFRGPWYQFLYSVLGGSDWETARKIYNHLESCNQTAKKNHNLRALRSGHACDMIEFSQPPSCRYAGDIMYRMTSASCEKTASFGRRLEMT